MGTAEALCWDPIKVVKGSDLGHRVAFGLPFSHDGSRVYVVSSI